MKRDAQLPVRIKKMISPKHPPENKECCDKCDQKWMDQFIPSKEVETYFSYVYTGQGGFAGRSYQFKNANANLVPTHAIWIDNKPHCPYCGSSMYVIQDPETFTELGYCCICQGARDEIEYEKRKKELEEKYEKELVELEKSFRDKLKFRTDKLFEIKQKNEKEKFERYNCHVNTGHFSTLNGKIYTDIDQIIR